jgi:ABC-type dipeptide/oligopeptide/nickel transport system permease subunit
MMIVVNACYIFPAFLLLASVVFGITLPRLSAYQETIVIHLSIVAADELRNLADGNGLSLKKSLLVTISYMMKALPKRVLVTPCPAVVAWPSGTFVDRADKSLG